ncbi:TRAP transporter substrate-binding protein [Ralstonia pseudosolanacearum]|uniref:TRAP transporter substrate-binding protein n=1 Tax=Ralstonia pseudosolanacearum TaxID=1310165 RepID=UPI002004BA27|nr:TRAP transporter substrate-binding protein [Ralstonia pseudosolanacearum]MCK4126572.1 TRAP transporter substrate-binding protein [Ralstonia pseudosolanacearum]
MSSQMTGGRAMPARRLLCVFAGALSLLSAVHAHAETFRVATAYPATNFHTQNLQAFAGAVGPATGGELRLEVYPSGMLLKPAAIFDGVKEGKAEGGEVMLSTLAQRDPMFGVDSIPFLVENYNDARLLWEASRHKIESLMKASGLRLLYAVPWPPQNLYSSTPIARLSDLRGHRLRTYNAEQKRIADLYGAQPIPVEAADLGAAITAGRIDTMLTSPSTGLETRAGQRLTYYYKVNAWIPKNAVFVSEARFARLSPAAQQAVLKLAAEYEKRGWEASRQTYERDEVELAKTGVRVINPDVTLLGDMRRLGERLTREWLRSVGTEEVDILLSYEHKRKLN